MMIGLVEFCNKFAVDVFEIYIIIRLLRAIFKNDLIDKRFLFLPNCNSNVQLFTEN